MKASKIIIKLKVALSLFICLDQDGPAEKTLGIMHLNAPTPNIPSKRDVLFIIQAAEWFLSNDQFPNSFRVVAFYMYKRVFLDGLHARSSEQAEEQSIGVCSIHWN